MVVLWLAVFWPVLSGARVLYYGDLALYFIPQFDFQSEVLRAGRLPLWNPYVLAGVPFVGNPQASPLYPPAGLASAWPAEQAVGVFGALHCLWAALGAWLLLRRFGIGVAGSWLGAVVFSFGGALISKLQFPNMAAAASWMPWLLWAFDRSLAAPSARTAGVWGLVLALSVLSSHPQVTYFGLLVCLAWGAVRMRGRVAWGWWLVGSVAGGLLAACWLLPVTEATLRSVRPQLGLAQANRFVLPPEGLGLLWVDPWFYGSPFSADGSVLSGNVWESCVFVGWVPVVLAGAGAWFGRREGLVRWWGVVFLVSVWLSLGRVGGLFTVAHAVVPGLSKFHDPARFLLVSQWALAVLSAVGLDRLRVAPGWRRSVAIGTLIALTAWPIAGFVSRYHPTVSRNEFRLGLSRLAAKVPGRELVWHTGVLAGWRRSIDSRGYGPLLGPGSAVEFLASGLPNLPMLVRARMADGYEPVRPSTTDGRRRALMADGAGTDRPRRESLARRYGVGVSGVLVSTGLETSWVRCGPGERLVGNDLERRVVAGVVQDRGEGRVALAFPAEGGEWTLRDTSSPGWSLRVEGRPRSWWVDAETGYRRFRTFPGETRAEWVYDPVSWRAGLFLSLTGGCILALMSSGCFRRRFGFERHV